MLLVAPGLRVIHVTTHIGLLDAVARETRDRHARAYIIDQLQVIAGGVHDIRSCDDNLDRWQRRLRVREGLDAEGDG